VQGSRNSEDDFGDLSSGAGGAVSERRAPRYRPADDLNGYPPERDNGYPFDRNNWYPADRSNGYPTDPGYGNPLDRSDGYPVSHSNGYPVQGSRSYPVDRSSGYPVDRSSGYPVDRSGSYPVDGSGSYPVNGSGGYPVNRSGGYPVALGHGRDLDRSESYGVLERAPRHAVDDPHAALFSGPTAEMVPYRRPGDGIQLPPPGSFPVLVAPGTGPRLGVRAAVVTLVAIVVLATIGYVVYATTQTPPLTNLSAEVVSTGQVALGFPQAGVLTGVLVHPGDHVAAGSMLATEMVAGLNQQVTADQEAVHTDQLDIHQLDALLNAANQQAAASTSSARQVAGAGVSSAAAAIGSTVPARQAAISAFQSEVTIANQTLQSDESSYAKTCDSSPTGGADCQSLAHQVATDKLSLAAAQANLSAQQAAQADWAAEANRLLADQEAAQTGLNGSTTLTLAPLEVDVANAKDQLVRDQAQLATDQAKKAEGELQAPQSGTVLSVDGEPGEVVSGAGVAGGNASGGSVTVTPGFELFPAQQSNAGSQGSSSPVVVLQVGGPLVANVVVPESQIGLVHVGARVTITPKVAGPRATTGVVTEIFPSSIVAAGVVSYEVQVKGSAPASTSGWLPGMTASATIGR
jgi:multidrug efflux pump subunit AcrA (membrane-fusion protein)